MVAEPQVGEAKEKKLNRTETLLTALGVDPVTFNDPRLPNGVFSHSQYNSFKICGKAYEFRYLRKQPSKRSGAMVRGITIHSGVEFALRAKMEGRVALLAEVIQHISEEFDRDKGTVDDWGDIDPTKAKDGVIEMYQAYHTYAVAKMNPVAVEQGFASNFGGVPMIGFIDLIDRVPAIDTGTAVIPDGPTKDIVVDLKTTTARWSERDLATDTQMTLYCGVTGSPDFRVDQLVQLKKGTQYVPGKGSRTQHDVNVLGDDIHEVTELIKGGIFPKASIDSWGCNKEKCAYWADCRGKQR